MVATDRVRELFADARLMQMHEPWNGWQRMIPGTRQKKAWCATKRATDGLLLARTGREPQTPAQTAGGLRALAFQDARFQRLRSFYNTCVKELHSDCFYDGHCEPAEQLAETIRETGQYIGDAERLAGD